MVTGTELARDRRALWPGSVIDVDVHAVVPSIQALYPYLPEVWQEYIDEREWAGPPDTYTYPPALGASVRSEFRPSGQVAASSVDLLRRHVLDPWNVDAAIINCLYPIDSGHPYLSAAMASAVNDWLIAEWLEADDRLRASIVLPVRDPALMVAEVERVGAHPGFVQALAPVRSGRLYGNPTYQPFLEALARHDLVMGLHMGGINDGDPPTPSGWPSWYVEEYAADIQIYQAQIASLLAHGAFQRLDSLRVSVLEAGFLWVPAYLWRLDKEWKGLRRDTPWLDRPPSAIIRDHVRFATSPMDLGPLEAVRTGIGWLGSEDLLMFSTDYPHAHADDLPTLLAASSEAGRSNMMAEAARRWYRL